MFRSGQIEPGKLDDRVGAASNAQLSQDLGDMHLDRGDGDIKLVCDMLVLQASTDHVENAKLLGGETRQFTEQILNFRTGAPCRRPMEALRDIDVAFQN